MALAAVSLEDKYTLESGRVFLTGTQALVRLPMMQRQRDQAAGLNTGCFISGYRGSPLGAVDQQLWAAKRFLATNHIHFQPGVNEDLAATAIWGSQQSALFGDSNYDGVFSMWYGKGPGADRCGDVFKHGNSAGSSAHGGVLLMVGDDHTAKSSTLAHQCEYTFMDAMIPVLNPAGVQEFLDLGIFGWALSRYSGCWVGFKTIGETVDSSASVYVDPHRIEMVQPEDFEMPEGGLNIRWTGATRAGVLAQEENLHRYKLYAALAFARANKLDRQVLGNAKTRLGIVTAGKSYLDVRQALEDLGIDQAKAEEIGIAVYKVGMTWPLEREGIRNFAEGLEEVLVIEEKRAVIENQLKEQLYNWRADVRPRVIGKFDEEGDWILPSTDELTPARIARVISRRIARFHSGTEIWGDIEARLKFLADKEAEVTREKAPIQRIPYFCSGCPHNTSTKVPEGSRALAGIGCHYMVQWMDRETATFTQMGGEGVPWIGQAPFSKTKHIFANLGDGTYYHSGILAVRACVAADINITFKLLYNDAVAMTGGQTHDGPLDPAIITRQLYGEGVGEIVVVTDEPDKYPIGYEWAPGVTVHHRDELDSIQKRLRETEGVTAIVYDQTCAAEKRRRRKRGLYPDPPKRVFINDLVCEGCGDCSVQSNCLSVTPLETEFGRKRAIDQSSCNKDFSCLKGFCPSFVTVHGGKPRKSRGEKASDAPVWGELPEPQVPALEAPYNIVVTGVGGTGVVTIGALLGMAAHIEGKGCSVLDMAGLAQKGGAVVSHVRFAAKPEDLHAVRISAGGADLLLGCDLVVAAGFEALSKITKNQTHAVINSQETVTGEFTSNPDFVFPDRKLQDLIAEAAGPGKSDFLEATRLATALLGDSIATNLFMLGFAWQKGLVPVSEEALNAAIELNGVAVAANKEAFLWGRRAAVDAAKVAAQVAPKAEPSERHLSESLDEVIQRRIAFLTDYQNAAYAARYEALVARAREAETAKAPGKEGLTEAVARAYFKLLAVKDEYEVARLYADPAFLGKVRQQFEGDFKLSFHLAPPVAALRDPETGHLTKREFGPRMMWGFKILAKLKGLRGTAFDLFGRTAERRMERQLIKDYEATMEEVIAGLDHETHGLAISIASVPQEMRGFGHIKEANVKAAKAQEAALIEAFRNPQAAKSAAE